MAAVAHMQLIRLDAAGWRSPDDFYSALLPELGAPDWHGRNLNALYDSLMGDINSLEPPFEIEIEGAAELPQNMKAFLDEVISVFEDARRVRGRSFTQNLLNGNASFPPKPVINFAEPSCRV